MPINKKFWAKVDADYKANIRRQRMFKRLVQRVACPDCGQKGMKLTVYKNDPVKGEYEVLVACRDCGFTEMIRHDGVMAEYADKPPK